MIEPKLFYRNFDDLLKKIAQDARGKNFLRSILNEIHKNFQGTLHIGSLRLYEDKGDNFELTEAIGTQRNPVAKKISSADEALQKVLKHGSFIYDERLMSIAPEMSKQDTYAIPAAILIRCTEQRWIAVFELKEGWVREEVTFSLNCHPFGPKSATLRRCH